MIKKKIILFLGVGYPIHTLSRIIILKITGLERGILSQRLLSFALFMFVWLSVFYFLLKIKWIKDIVNSKWFSK